MKDAIGFAIFLGALVASLYIEDRIAERCVEHGFRWVKTTGCSTDYCDRSGGKSKP